MTNDKEIAAMSSIRAALADLDTDAIGRVLRWAAERHNVAFNGFAKVDRSNRNQDSAQSNTSTSSGNTTHRSFADLSDLYDAADPSDERNRVLVAGYWFQVIQGQNELDSQSLNKALGQLGHGVSHMPHAVSQLMKAKPRLMIQLKKQGTTRQARRKYKLTFEGIKKVKGMLSG